MCKCYLTYSGINAVHHIVLICSKCEVRFNILFGLRNTWYIMAKLLGIQRQLLHLGLGPNNIRYFTATATLYQARYNPLDIQMLSESLHKQIFGHVASYIGNEEIHKSIEHLSGHNLYGRHKSEIADVDFKLPPLRGQSIEEHFEIIAQEQTKNYVEMAKHLSLVSLPSRPKEWCFEPGWTKYIHDGDFLVGIPVECPDGDVMVFDVEVCVNEGQFPTLAVMVTPENW